MDLVTILSIVGAFFLGMLFGIFWIIRDRSLHTTKFKKRLKQAADDYEKYILELQKKDAEALQQAQKLLEEIMSKAILYEDELPPRNQLH